MPVETNPSAWLPLLGRKIVVIRTSPCDQPGIENVFCHLVSNPQPANSSFLSVKEYAIERVTETHFHQACLLQNNTDNNPMRITPVFGAPIVSDPNQNHFHSKSLKRVKAYTDWRSASKILDKPNVGTDGTDAPSKNHSQFGQGKGNDKPSPPVLTRKSASKRLSSAEKTL
ncbi:unnamed protein product [Ceratitis capitata]|uniref:(Mediterranean fruit fly) hypothetical protein n=1 Tax=Ceratitis capitata TaxID=7213 RepID=A0A811V2W7_CERCA|nr:unnamed protein product [Ceratitis capitata]